jgi:GNAT superfamily N-acetyltransferase
LKKYAGFLNFYIFNLDINKSRNRLSQTLLLPQYQRKGLGYLLIQKFTEYSMKNENCF